MTTYATLILGLVVSAGAVCSGDDWCGHAPDPRPRQETPAGTMNFPPPLDADFEHMRLELEIADMNTPEIDATQRLYLRAIAYELSELTLDAQLLEIASVEAPGYVTSFEADGRTLVVRFDPPAPVGERVELITRYRIVDPPRGLMWTTQSPAFPGRAAQIHTQGQPESNSFWFPCHDFPNDRLTTELIVTSPQGYQVVSNGRLVGKDRKVVRGVDLDGRHDLKWYDLWHWSQDEQAGGNHTPYLVTLVVGKFDVVDLGTPKLPMPVYVPPGRGGDVKVTYGDTPKMIEFFGRILDEPYPWSKYAQVLVWNFGAGGMENTSATSMFDGALFGQADAIDQDFDGLIAHELGHQWFGDLITCNSWEHIWLNEGFATYLSHLWREHEQGPAAYLAGVMGSMDGLIANDRGTAPNTPGMASKIYDHPWETFGRAANPYPKGASILHMLRRKLGDRRFFAGVAEYINRHRLSTVETDDFRRAMEDVSGESLEQFFDQWVFRPGIPRLAISTAWDEAASELVVSVEQTQTIDEHNPAFVFDLPIWLRYPGQGGVQSRVETLSMDTRSASMRIALPARPDIVAYNHDLSVLAELKIDQAASLWLEQLASGPTVAAKIQAARAFANADGKPGAMLLFATARDESAPEALRLAAVKALEAQGDLSRVFFLVPPSNPGSIGLASVREEIMAALGRMGHDHPTGSMGKAREQIIALLVERALNDPSSKVRASAVRALGVMRATGAGNIVMTAADVESPQDAIRRAALESLGDLNLPEALPVVLRYARPGSHDRTRPVAIAAARRLMVHDDAVVRAMLGEALNDRERRAWEEAAEQIAAIGGPWAVDLLQRRLERTRNPGDRRRLEGWIDRAGRGG
ncbi:MAG: HEAT repeat domain-containing protein [Phycisphaerales bacterium]|nr:HEAT repeat domain-containing protein [Phycisphaerales bacterium]